MTDEQNVFEKMETEQSVVEEQKVQQVETAEAPENNAGEVDYDKLSSKPAGRKFERVLLDGKTITVSNAQLFNPNVGVDKIQEGFRNKENKHYNVNLIISYESEDIPEDKPQREYMSGTVVHIQKDGSLSEHKIYWERSKTQAADLWRTVAKFKGVNAEDLDIRTFMSFLKSKPKAIVEVREFENPTNGNIVKKNMISKFI